jgi:hypothetical protein
MKRTNIPQTAKASSISIFAPVFLLALLLFMTGCSKTIRITNLGEEINTPTNPGSVELLPIEELSKNQYKILGKVYARHKGGLFMGKGVDDLQNTIKDAAAKMGADAVIGFKTSKQDDQSMKSSNSRWGSGIAVRRVVGGAKVSARCDFLVVFCGNRHLNFESWKQSAGSSYENFVKDSVQNEKNWSYIFSATEYQMERRGYYVLNTAASRMNIYADSISKYDDGNFNNLFGSLTGHVFHIDLIGADSYNAGIAAGASAEVKALLYSKETEGVVWENAASKSLFPILVSCPRNIFTKSLDLLQD